MILVITRLCYALYLTEGTAEPLEVTCLDFDAPVQYDVTECEGEVTTPADMSSESAMSATCETELY